MTTRVLEIAGKCRIIQVDGKQIYIDCDPIEHYPLTIREEVYLLMEVDK